MLYREYENMSFYGMLERTAQKYGEKPAISFNEDGTPQTKTYAELFYDVRVLGKYLEKNGLKGKYVVVDSRNTYAQLVSMFAVMAMGAVAAILNFDLPEDDIRSAFTRIEPAMIIYDSEDADFVHTLSDAPCLCCTPDENSYEHTSVVGILSSETALLAANASLDPSSPAAVLMTSGSTSISKLVLLSHASMLPFSDLVTTKSLMTYPLYHVAGIKMVINDLARGTHTCLSDFKRGLDDIDWFRPVETMAIPLFVNTLVKRAKLGLTDITCFKAIHTGGAPQDPDIKAYLDTFGIFSASFYGTTETAGINTCAYPETYKPGSVGCLGEWNPGRVSDEGEIQIKSRCGMMEYLKDEDATRAAFTEDGWYKTGDVGKIDQDSFLYITGRIKNIIILSNGENVSPEAIEARLLASPDIDEAVVYGEEDEIRAAVWSDHLTDEKKAAVEAFVKGYNKTVPSYHKVKKVVFRDKPFERTASNKIKRNY